MAFRTGVQGQPLYIGEMMQRLGIEAGTEMLPRAALGYAAALRRCRTCASKEDCRAWLDATRRTVEVAPRFCPNGEILFEMRFDQLGSASVRNGAADTVVQAAYPTSRLTWYA